MIKQIQLRGISRTPSDRMTADGGCAESLNVHLTDNELSPTLAPENVTGELGLPANATKEYIYIHKGNGYTNYITLEGMEIGAYRHKINGEEYEYQVIDYMEQGETLQSVSGIGNTLVVMGTKHPYYALFKDGVYVPMGSIIPLPTIQLTPDPVEDTEGDYLIETIREGQDEAVTPPSVVFDKQIWNEKASKAEQEGKRYAGIDDLSEDKDEEDGRYYAEEDILQLYKKSAVTLYAKAKADSVLVNQVMVLYGIHLYNNAYITSVPVLMPGGFEWPLFCRYYREAADYGGGHVSSQEVLQVGARYPYRIKARLMDFDQDTLELWSDIIMSIDFFMTPIIPFDASTEKVAYVKNEYIPSRTSGFSSSVVSGNITSFEIQPCSNKYAKKYLNRVLQNGSGEFRKVVSLSTDSMAFESRELINKLREGDILDLNEFITDQDLLDTQRALAEFSYDMRNAERTSKMVTSMNNRLLLTGVTETIPSGSSVFPGAPCVLSGENAGAIPYIEESYRDYNTGASYSLSYWRSYHSKFSYPQRERLVQIVYHIRGRENYVVRGRIGTQGSFVESVDENLAYFGFLIFPDSRCWSVDIYLSYNGTTWYMKSYEMREHPGFNAAYMYAGVETNLLWDVGHVDIDYRNGSGRTQYSDNSAGRPTADTSLIKENRIEQRDNVLLLSDVDTPWYYPLENEYTMQATEIFGTALATKALSTGQFGQFPLYVFTDNGIFAMQMSSSGTFTSSHAVSMDVAKTGTILSLDQAVAFVTDKGLMLLTGSDIQNISPNMNGKHYAVEADAGALIRKSEWNTLLEAVTDDSHFISFMEGSRLAYDYTGDRIICFNGAERYMYVYMLKTASWHKMSMPESVQFSRLLNSYPDTYVSVTSKVAGSSVRWARILNFSTPLDVTSGELVRGIIATRPLDLGEPDIRKTIKSIRIRGQYNRNDVRYILLGSMDGLNWGVLPSLRGGSYKLYRLVILTSLSPTERISWIDIDYESRFANKLRQSG